MNGCDLNNPKLANRNKGNLEEYVAKWLVSQGVDDGATTEKGIGYRLNPLYTEEVMGFPYGWTTFPFLSHTGETNQ